MKALSVTLSRSHYAPGDLLEGTAAWQFATPPKSAEVRLFWFTTGKGTRDTAIVERASFDAPADRESRPFRFTLPDSPWSFSGKLITLTWSVELVVPPERETNLAEFIMAPGSSEIRLDLSP